ncbi:substrate-binding domain-containing protein [Chloroflexi bacterium TSY]|nr:substrate-binding domain-containing protein [Chloroflexi bacterium TSY]
MLHRMSRRDFLRLSAGAVGATALMACTPAAAPEQSSTQDTADASPGKKTEIRFASFDWFANVPGIQWAEYHETEAFPQYYEEQGDVEILWEPHGDGWSTKVLTNMAAGTAPDVMSTWPPIINTWSEKGQLLDLQPLVDVDIPDADDIFLKTGWDQCWDPFTQTRMSLVTNVDVNSIYYSKDAFDEAGVPYPAKDWTVEDCTEIATQLILRDDNGNITRWGGELRPSYELGYFHFVDAFGGMVRDEDTQMTCLLGEEQALQALEWIREGMWDINCFAQRNQINATGIPNTWTGALPANVVAFMGRSADMFFDLADSLPEGSWDINHAPAGPEEAVCHGSPDVWCIYKGVAERGNQDAAWEYLKWMGAGEWYQDNVAKRSARLPGLTSSAEKWPGILREIDGRLEPVDLEVILDQLKTNEARGPQLFRFQSVAEELFKPAMDSIFVEGAASVSIMEDVAQQITEAQMEALEREGQG